MTKIKGIVEQFGDTKHNIMLKRDFDQKSAVYSPTNTAFKFAIKSMLGKRVELTLLSGYETIFSFIRITSDQSGVDITEGDTLPAATEESVVTTEAKETTQIKPKQESYNRSNNECELCKGKCKFDIKPYIINLQGKDFIKHEGLLKLARHKGLAGIETQIITYNMEKGYCIVKATITMQGKRTSNMMTAEPRLYEYQGIGDATLSNTNKQIQPHFIRMAETRAINRALRFATGLGIVSEEEVSENGD